MLSAYVPDDAFLIAHADGIVSIIVRMDDNLQLISYMYGYTKCEGSHRNICSNFTCFWFLKYTTAHIYNFQQVMKWIQFDASMNEILDTSFSGNKNRQSRHKKSSTHVKSIFSSFTTSKHIHTLRTYHVTPKTQRPDLTHKLCVGEYVLAI